MRPILYTYHYLDANFNHTLEIIISGTNLFLRKDQVVVLNKNMKFVHGYIEFIGLIFMQTRSLQENNLRACVNLINRCIFRKDQGVIMGFSALHHRIF